MNVGVPARAVIRVKASPAVGSGPNATSEVLVGLGVAAADLLLPGRVGWPGYSAS